MRQSSLSLLFSCFTSFFTTLYNLMDKKNIRRNITAIAFFSSKNALIAFEMLKMINIIAVAIVIPLPILSAILLNFSLFIIGQI